MTQEEKQLLTKDLCARLPYNILVLEDLDQTFDGGCVGELVTISEHYNEKVFLVKNCLTPVTIEEIRPYLRSMSNMTKNERDEYYSKWGLDGQCIDTFDWLNSHYFDYRGLIQKGLALEATKEMYYNN